MPPQGESVGMALEDVMVFARLMAHHQTHSFADLFSAYERLRRKRIGAAYEEASFRWETVKDAGWLAQTLKEWMTPLFLWWTAKARNASFEEDVTSFDLGLNDDS